MPCPGLVKSLGESKVAYTIMAFFIFAQVSQGLRSTGAYEIEINDQVVYSKLETGQHVDAQKLQNIFEQYGVSFIQSRPQH